jgi:hypothetical protein
MERISRPANKPKRYMRNWAGSLANHRHLLQVLAD